MGKYKVTSYPYRFPWREGNRFELLIDGDQFFPRMLDAISCAQYQVQLEIYLFESGHVANRFIDTLHQAAERGVAIYLLLDDFGTRKLDEEDRQKLEHNNIHLVLYNPLETYSPVRNIIKILRTKSAHRLQRDHRKLLVIDGQTAYLGGAGITDEFDPACNPESYWRETMIEIKGPVVTDWRQIFESTWNQYAASPLLRTSATSADIGGDSLGRASMSEGPGRNDIKRALIKHITSAEYRVWLATAYFIPSWKIRRNLRLAALNGVDVRLLLPGPHSDHPAVRHAGRRYYTRLLRHGVRIFEYQPRFFHAKTVLCDHWVSIGSTNFDHWNLYWNLEANQEIDDQSFSNIAQEMFENDFSVCVEYTYEEWSRRAWRFRLMEWFWGKLDRLSVKMSSRIQGRKK